MAKKKAKHSAAAEGVTETKAPRQPRKPGSLLQRAWPALALLVLTLALALGGAYLKVRQAEETHRDTLAQLYRQHYVSVLNSYTRNYGEIVSALPDIDLLPYLQSGAGTETGLLNRFPGALYARVAPARLDPAIPNGLSFAHQDMVLRLAAGKPVAPEISFYENGSVREQVVTFARVLKDSSGTRAGVLLLSFPFQPLAKALQGFAPEAGSLELLQKVGNDGAVIFRSGQGVSTPEPLPETATNNPNWKLRFTPGAALGEVPPRSPLLLGLAVLLPLLAGGIFAGALLLLQRRVREDAEAIDTFSDNYFQYGTRQRPPLHFGFSAALLSRLEQFGGELRAGRSASRAPVDELGDLGLTEPDTALFGAAPAPAAPPVSAKESKETSMKLNPEIFRAYDIRGVVGKGLDAEVARALGQAIGSEAQARGDDTVIVGRDGRLSGPELSAALIDGLRATGCAVVDVGMVPTPALYFAAKTVGKGSGVMVTGSHNPADYNGFKIMLAGDTLAGNDIQALRQRMESRDFRQGEGSLRQLDVGQEYVDRVAADIALARGLRVVVDGGNGAAGPLGVRTLEAIGCEVMPLFCEVDGNFPNHHPDPSKPQNLEDLLASVASNQADLGIAFDGDGDRIGVVTAQGKIIYPDRLMMLYAKHVLTTNPGADIIFDVKCTRDLPALISGLGGRPVMCKTGHSFIKGKLKETGAALAGEMSGHVFFNDRWFGFDDAIYSAARLLEILALESGDSDEVFAEFPENPSTPEINIPVPDEGKFGLMEALRRNANFPDANVITLDGVRVEFAESWGLVRASNTTPCLVARFEGRTPAALADVQAKFKALLNGVDASLKVPF